MIVCTCVETTEGQQPAGNRATAPQEQTSGPVPTVSSAVRGPRWATLADPRGRVAPSHPKGNRGLKMRPTQMARGGKPRVNPPRRVYRPLGGLLLKTSTGYLMAPEVLAAMVRKQLNLSLTLEQYKWLEELAQEAGETPTKYARHIVLDAISPAPETDLNSGVLVLPFWLAHFLLFPGTTGSTGETVAPPGPE